MSEIIRRNVIIIGAGPAGSVAASELARRGHRPLLLEKDFSPGEKNACAGILDYAMRDHLNLPGEVIDKEIGITRINYRGKVAEYQSNNLRYLSVQRRIFDRYLAFRTEREGPELLTAHRALKNNSFGSGTLSYYDRSFRRTKYYRWLKLLSLPCRLVEYRQRRSRYAFYPEILRGFFSFTSYVPTWVKKI